MLLSERFLTYAGRAQLYRLKIPRRHYGDFAFKKITTRSNSWKVLTDFFRQLSIEVVQEIVSYGFVYCNGEPRLILKVNSVALLR